MPAPIRACLAAAGRALRFAAALVAATAPALASHGALATAEDGRFGWSHDYRTQFEADRKALQECGRRCSILFQFRDTCAAYATGYGGAYGWERHDNERYAREIALERCLQHARDCRVRVSTCAF